MKKIYFLLIFMGISGFVRGQYFEQKFEDNDEVDMVVVTKDMFSLINEIGSSKDKDLKNFYAQLQYLGMFGSSNPDVAFQLKSEARNYVSSKGMKLLVKIKNPGKIANFYYIPDTQKGFAKELLLVVEFPGEKRVSVLHVTGHINMKKISLLALQATGIDREILKEAEKAVH